MRPPFSRSKSSAAATPIPASLRPWLLETAGDGGSIAAAPRAETRSAVVQVVETLAARDQPREPLRIEAVTAGLPQSCELSR